MNPVKETLENAPKLRARRETLWNFSGCTQHAVRRGTYRSVYQSSPNVCSQHLVCRTDRNPVLPQAPRTYIRSSEALPPNMLDFHEERRNDLHSLTLLDYFDQVVVLNLPKRADRRRAISYELAAQGMQLGFPRVRIFPAIRPREAFGFPNSATCGCFRSHLSVLKTAKEQNLRNLVICEDDLAISPLLRENLPDLMNEIGDAAWDLIYFGHNLPCAPGSTPHMALCGEPIGLAHFYAINGTIFGRLVTCLEQIEARSPGDPQGGPMHYDGALSTFREQNPDVRTWIALPSLGWQRSSRSDIHPHWYETLPGLRGASDLGRILRERFRKSGFYGAK